MIDLDRFCAYARIDVQDDEATLTTLLAAAEQHVAEVTGKARPPDGGDELYDLAVMMLAAHWYDNRTPVGSETAEIPYTLTMLLHHLALCGRYPEVSASEPDQ